MIQSKEEYLDYIAKDKEANKISDSFHSRIRITWRYLKCLRKLEYFTNCKCTYMYKIYILFLKYRLYRLSVRSGITIPENTFGKGLYIPHHGLIVVNSNVKFGNYCILQTGVNISDGVRGGNYIYIGTGAKIMRNVELSDEIIVGANAVVTKSFKEKNTVLGGVPAKIISSNGYKNRIYV